MSWPLSSYIIDAIWAIDVELEDLKADRRTASAASETDEDKSTIVDLGRKLLVAHIVDPAACRERLDAGLSSSIGLLSDLTIHNQKEVRARTALFYKQNKFNLLREQTEGYTKLSTELAAGIGPSHDPSTGCAVENPAAILYRAKNVWERIVALIGYFDLDPNRALDILIDVFSAHITTHHSFFITLLRLSPWCRASKRLQAQREPSKMDVDEGTVPEHSRFRECTFDEALRIAEGHEPSTEAALAPVCAQVVGFKFEYYQKDENKDLTPRSLLMTAALMIKEGLMTLEDVYMHLGPSDADMAKIQQQHEDNLQNAESTGSANALSAAAPLPKDDGPPSRVRPLDPTKPSTVAPKKQSPNASKRPIAQKIGIVAALLSVGALRPATKLLNIYPWMVNSHPEIADLLLRILQVSVEPRFRAYFPQDCISLSSALQTRQSKLRWSAVGQVPPPLPKYALTIFAPPPTSSASTELVFFYDGWRQNIPLCVEDLDLLTILEPLLQLLGVQLHRDLNSLVKLCQIARSQLQQKTIDSSLQGMWHRVLRSHILPSLSMGRAQSIIAVEVWNMLKVYDTPQRWQLYAEWGSASYNSCAELRLKRAEVNREIKSLMRRLSHENVDRFIMTITRIAHSNPCLLFKIIVNQVQSYENMGPQIIRVLGKISLLPHDVLTYTLVEAFSRPDREHVKDDGISISDWLTSLSAFSSGLFRTYLRLDLPSMLRYIVHQLKGSATENGVVLQDLITQMCGIPLLFDLSESQVVALRGGPLLQTEATASTYRGVLSNFSPRTADRFNSTLKSANLLFPLLILLAQRRQSCIHVSRNGHLKTLGHLYDLSQAQLLQYCEALNSNSNGVHYVLPLPPISELRLKFGLDAPICMILYQPKLRMEFKRFQELSEKQEQEDLLKSRLTKGTEQVLSPMRNHVAPTDENSIWVPMLESLFEDIKFILPPRAQEFLGVPFYATFWQLTMYDLLQPVQRHEDELLRLQSVLKGITDKIQRRVATEAEEIQRNKLQQYLSAFTAEATAQSKNCESTRQRLAVEKMHWFTSDQGFSKRVPMLATQIIKHCLHPRALMSQSDADFSAFVIQYLHQLGTPGFHTTAVYDKLLDDGITSTIFGCSEQEALNYGRFLFGMLNNLSKLHGDEDAWKRHNMRENQYLPGFQRSWVGRDKLEESDLLTWAEFKSLHKKWHRKLAGTLSQCLSSDEYIHIHNGVVILKEILDVFPIASVNSASGNWIYSTVESCLANETRQDLLILIGSYKARLASRRGLWSLDATMGEIKDIQQGPAPTNPPQDQRQSNQSSNHLNDGATSLMSVDQPESLPVEVASVRQNGQHNIKVNGNTITDAAMPSQPLNDAREHRGQDADMEVPGSRAVPQRAPLLSEKATDAKVTNGAGVEPEAVEAEASQMLPPHAPSSTLSAQELRLAARQSMPTRRPDGDKKSETDGEIASSERIATSANNELRSGTPQSESLPSQVTAESQPSDISSHSVEQEQTSRPIRVAGGESLDNQRSEQAEMPAVKIRAPPLELEKERGRDKEVEREKHRTVDQDRRERYRDRDRDRDRDRTRRDWEKGSDQRDKHSRDSNERGAQSSRRDNSTERSAHGRRVSSADDDHHSKRRRASDDEAERGSKRSGRHRENGRDSRDEETLRPRDRDGDKERSSDKRAQRNDRERGSGSDNERNSRNHSPEHYSGRSSRQGESNSRQGGNLPPSGPRAMSSTEVRRSTPRVDISQSRDPTKTRRDRERDRDQVLHHTSASPSNRKLAGEPSLLSAQTGSLRSRISDDISRNSPSTPPSEGDRGATDDTSKKRTYSDRVSDNVEAGETNPDASTSSNKKPRRLNRNRISVSSNIQKHLDQDSSRSNRS